MYVGALHASVWPPTGTIHLRHYQLCNGKRGAYIQCDFSLINQYLQLVDTLQYIANV